MNYNNIYSIYIYLHAFILYNYKGKLDMGSIILGLEAVCGCSCNFQCLKTPEEFPHFRYFVDESGEITRSLQTSVIVCLYLQFSMGVLNKLQPKLEILNMYI